MLLAPILPLYNIHHTIKFLKKHLETKLFSNSLFENLHQSNYQESTFANILIFTGRQNKVNKGEGAAIILMATTKLKEKMMNLQKSTATS